MIRSNAPADRAAAQGNGRLPPILLDSNIFIYMVLPENQRLRDWMTSRDCAASVISYVEATGYAKITAAEVNLLDRLFAVLPLFEVTTSVSELAADYRQRRKMSLGDALIAATAAQHGLALATRNVKDFQWIGDFDVIDPLA